MKFINEQIDSYVHNDFQNVMTEFAKTTKMPALDFERSDDGKYLHPATHVYFTLFFSGIHCWTQIIGDLQSQDLQIESPGKDQCH